MSSTRYAMFWGCQIPARFPFMEKSWRVVLNALGVQYCDLDGFTCCPERSLARNLDPELWKLAAARNLAVACRAGTGLTTACTGCYSTLKSVASRLNCYAAEREGVNAALARADLTYERGLPVKHLVEVLHDEVGMGALTSRVVRPFTRLRTAVHGGCHLVRPSNAVHFDDPLKPVKLDNLVTALGARVVATPTRMLCCGGSLDRVNQSERAMIMTRAKLKDLRAHGVEALVVVCPECFKAYDNTQFLLQRRKERYDIPVLTYAEMLGLALGMDSEELGLGYHRIPPTALLARLDRASA